MDQLFIFIGPYHIIIEMDTWWPIEMNALYFYLVVKYVFECVEKDEDLSQLDYFVGIAFDDAAYDEYDFFDDDPGNFGVFLDEL